MLWIILYLVSNFFQAEIVVANENAALEVVDQTEQGDLNAGVHEMSTSGSSAASSLGNHVNMEPLGEGTEQGESQSNPVNSESSLEPTVSLPGPSNRYFFL